MQAILEAIAITLFAWWFGTGLVLYLDGLPRRTFGWTMAGATLLGIAGLAGLAESSTRTSPAAAYAAFGCALTVWAWSEIGFLLGIVTGPRRVPCPEDARGWRRVCLALQVVLHHEAALLGSALAVLAVTWEQPNQTGWWTFAILWAMRQSAKLNVFFGVRNLGESFLPVHLAYLHSYFRRRALNALLPVSIAAATVVVVPLWQAAGVPTSDPFRTASLTLLATLLTLAIAEHAFMVVPLPIEKLWHWCLRSRVRRAHAVPTEERLR